MTHLVYVVFYCLTLWPHRLPFIKITQVCFNVERGNTESNNVIRSYLMLFHKRKLKEKFLNNKELRKGNLSIHQSTSFPPIWGQTEVETVFVFQFLLGDSEVFPGQMIEVIPPVSSGSTPSLLPGVLKTSSIRIRYR